MKTNIFRITPVIDPIKEKMMYEIQYKKRFSWRLLHNANYGRYNKYFNTVSDAQYFIEKEFGKDALRNIYIWRP